MSLLLLKRALSSVKSIFGFLFILSLNCEALNLAQQPLTLSGFNYPNVMFLVDDSGSMDWEIMTGVHWAACDYDPYEHNSHDGSTSTDCNEKVTNGRMYIENATDSSDLMSYVYSNTGNIYSDCSNTNGYTFECSGSNTEEWRHRSSDLNFMFYNPDTDYLPWFGECSDGVDCVDASFSAARSNPRSGQSGYSQTRNLAGQSYEVWFDTAGFADTRPNITDYTVGANGYVDLWDEHYNIEFDSTTQIVITESVYGSPGANSLDETKTVLATLTNTLACYNILGSQLLVESIHNGDLDIASTGGVNCRTIPEAVQNFANWYQYHRKRSFAAKYTIGSLVSSEDDMRFGLTLINNNGSGDNDVFVEVPSGGQDTFSVHNNALMQDMYDYSWEALGTPLRIGLKTVGRYYSGSLSGKADPIIYSCQQNYTILMSDGEWSGGSPDIGNSDGDAYSNTLADVADYYYQTDLSDLEDDVPINEFDTQTQQHMVTIMAAFGLEGALEDTDGDGWPDPILGRSSTWGGNPSSGIYKADDMWHGAFNSKGLYSSAKSPDLLKSNLENAFDNIQARVGSFASVATGSSTLQNGAVVYQTEYQSLGWEGHLKASEILNDVVQSPIWDAACYFSDDCDVPGFNPANITYGSRVVMTYADGGIPFRWPSDYTNPTSTELTSGQVSDLLGYNNTIYSSDAYGQKLVNFIRGSDNDELNAANTSGVFRSREGRLGDFVNSRPIFVSAPSRFYPADLEGASYTLFKSTYSSRANMLYVGGNDGMLHGFDASDGEELLAYVPGSRHIYEDLYSLSSTNYSHKYYVDGSPTEGDVYYDGAWHTVLAGGLRAGGQSVYLLDITNPANFSEANAANIVKWEFSDVQDNELGATFSQPQIARLANGKWAVLFGNGYNNTTTDGYASATGKSYLFILFLNNSFDGTWDEGVDYVKIPVGSEYLAAGDAAGLSGITVVDVDGDYTADYVYGGDVKGKLWRFDLTSNSPGNWSGSLVFDAGVNQPITSTPVVSAHPNGLDAGFLVAFGTGKFIEIDDNSSSGQTTQTFYSIWDKRVAGVFQSVPVKGDLLEQEILSEPAFSETVGGRVTTANAIDWSTDRGWYLDLIIKNSGNNHGERVVFDPVVRSGRITFTTMVPASDNICDGGGGGWLMSLNAINGARPEPSAFDLNNDGVFSSGDYVDYDGGSYVSSGIQFNSGILSTPTLLANSDGGYDLNVLSSTGAENLSSGLTSIRSSAPGYASGRLSWRRIR